MADWWLLEGECLPYLKQLPDCSVDSVVCDPPAGIEFMAKGWDSFKTRAAFIAFLTEIMVECHRVLKPGGYALVWALPRTAHWTATAIEDAGFKIRDRMHDLAAADDSLQAFADSLDDTQRDALVRLVEGQSSPVLYHLFLNGMVKSQDARRQIEMHLCTLPGTHCDKNLPRNPGPDDHLCPQFTTPEADPWFDWRTGLKPTLEHWVVARKPLVGTLAENVLLHGLGPINVGDCRVPVVGEIVEQHGKGTDSGNDTYGDWNAVEKGAGADQQKPGRFTRHVMLSHAVGCQEGACVLACPVRLIDEQVGSGASRHFNRFHDEVHYSPKPSPAEKHAGLGHLDARQQDTSREADALGGNNPRNRGAKAKGNNHPTVKGIELMRHLVRLVTPPGGRVLDPFAGSGTTGIAAHLEGCGAILIERDPHYCKIIRARMAHWSTK